MLPPDARRTLLPSLALSLLALAGCGGDSKPPVEPKVPAALARVTPGALSGVAGEPLTAPIAVKVLTAKGAGLAGVTVTFTPGVASGSVGASTVVTNADGMASTTWVLGTTAGTELDTVRASVSELPNAPLVITASVRAAAAASLAMRSGDEQTAGVGEELAEPLVAIARDSFGNPASGVLIAWSAEGGGSIIPTVSTTDTAGEATARWKIGAGENVVRASASSIPTVPTVTFTASIGAPTVPRLDAIAPIQVTEGASATLTGVAFNPVASGNVVLVDGVVAPVTAATSTSLQIIVPTFDCRPPRTVPVRVVVGAKSTSSVDLQVSPAQQPTKLAVGEQLVLRDPAAFCLQFGTSAASEFYLIGIQSVSELPSSVTPAALTMVLGPQAKATMLAGALRAPAPQARGGTFAPLTTPSDDRWARHRAAESDLRARERQILAPAMRAIAAPRVRRGPAAGFSVTGAVRAGDTVAIKLPDLNSANFCKNYIPITTVVRAVGARGIWLEDVGNPSGGYTVDDFQAMSDMFDQKIYSTAAEYLGEPTDFDENGRVVVVTSKEVNKVQNVLGFVVSSDLYSTSICTSSNEGEFYYGRAPDPVGLYKSPAPYTLDKARLDAPFLIAHEFSHVIQFGRRGTFPGATAFQTSWEAEGQATFMEEVVGHRFTGRASRQNYGFDIAFNTPQTSNVDWYSNRFLDLIVYYGFQSRTSKATNSPEQCSWLGRKDEGNDGPCLPGREVYGVPALFLRWLTDHYGPTFPGGEQGLHRALIDNTKSGFATITDVVGAPMDELLAQFAAALYVDDRLPGMGDRMKVPSWNLWDIYGHFVETAQLLPRERSSGNFTDPVSVRAGSTAYFKITTGLDWPTSVRVRDFTDAPLPTHMRFWVLRLQ